MSPRSNFHAWILSAIIVFGVTDALFAQRNGGGRFAGGGGMYIGGGGIGGGFSRGGFYGGYGYPGYNSGLGFRSYGYGPRGYGTGLGIGVYPSPGYYSNPGYVTPQYSTPAYAYPNSSVTVTPSPSVAPFDNGPIVITNAATNDKSTDYMLNGVRFSIKPGQSQKFRHDRDWIVEFDRGDGRGLSQYGLKSATYKFKMTGKGWELFEAADSEPVSSELATEAVTIGPKSTDKHAPKPADDPTTVVPSTKVPKTPDEEAPKPDKPDVQSK